MTKFTGKSSVRILLTVLIAWVVTACYYDNEQDVYALFDDSVLCDTLQVTYDKHIKALFDAGCVSCHDGSHATCNLHTYEASQTYATQASSNLYTYVAENNHKNRVLTECEHQQLQIWIKNGAP